MEDNVVNIKDKNYFFIKGKKGSKKNKKERKKEGDMQKFDKLKKVVPYPDLLEFEDIKCDDVIRFNKIKNLKESIKVPERWKCKNLFPKTFKKPKYTLPSLLTSLGLDTVRYSYLDSKKTESSKDKKNERLFPKLGLCNIDCNILHDLFFPYKDLPVLSKYGEIFDFSWEFERKKCVPGVLSNELKVALGINNRSPPPWLFKMQEVGLPPSYPQIQIPGVNSEIPKGCKYGYEPEGWGKPIKKEIEGEIIDRLTDFQDKNINQYQYTNFEYVVEDNFCEEISTDKNIGMKEDANDDSNREQDLKNESNEDNKDFEKITKKKSKNRERKRFKF